MTNPQKKKQEILETWTTLKEKITKLTYLYQKSSLIREALEIYLNQSSSFTSLNSNEYLSSSFSYYTEQKKKLIYDLEQSQGRAREEELVQLRTELDRINQLLDRHSSEQQSFIQQKEKNEKIVKECKELLSKLEE